MQQKIKFYSIGCPKCKVLKIKLDKAKLEYDIIDDLQEMMSLGISTLPMLQVDEELMDFSKAITWINTLEGEKNEN